MKKLSLSAAIVSSIFFAACVPELPATASITTWYEDTDGDLYGDPNSSFTGDQPDNTWVADNTDCDDADSSINPSALEVNDLIDNNCDGAINNAPFTVGDYGPAGGFVFYISNAGLNGFEASPEDQENSEWGCYGVNVDGASSINIGSGEKNTLDILNAGCSPEGANSVAADVVNNYSLNGYDDWFLASRLEFVSVVDELYVNRNLISLGAARYWLSSEDSATNGMSFKVVDLDVYTKPKNQVLGVRSIRAF